MVGSRMCATRSCVGFLLAQSGVLSFYPAAGKSTKGPEPDMAICQQDEHLLESGVRGFSVHPESPEARLGSQGDLSVDRWPAKVPGKSTSPTWLISDCSSRMPSRHGTIQPLPMHQISSCPGLHTVSCGPSRPRWTGDNQTHRLKVQPWTSKSPYMG